MAVTVFSTGFLPTDTAGKLGVWGQSQEQALEPVEDPPETWPGTYVS